VEKTKWWEDVIEHPFPGDGHCIHCPSFLVWDWRDKCLQFVIQTGGKQIYQGRSHIRVIACKITGCNSHSVFRIRNRDNASTIRFWLPGTCLTVNTVCREDREKGSEFPLDSEDKPPLSYCLWLSTETVFESLEVSQWQ
jgi:hypothetical protein